MRNFRDTSSNTNGGLFYGINLCFNTPREYFYAHDKEVRGQRVPMLDASIGVEEVYFPPIYLDNYGGGCDTGYNKADKVVREAK